MHVAQCIKNCLALERIRHNRSCDFLANVKQVLQDSGILAEQQNSILTALNDIPDQSKFAWLQYLFLRVLEGFTNKYPDYDLVQSLHIAFETKTTKLSIHNIQIALILIRSKPCLAAADINAIEPLRYAAINEQLIPIDCIKDLARLINFCAFQIADIEQQLSSNAHFGINQCLNYARLILFDVDLNYFGVHLEHVYEMLAFHSFRTHKDSVEHRILIDAILAINHAFGLPATPEAPIASNEEDQTLYEEDEDNQAKVAPQLRRRCSI